MRSLAGSLLLLLLVAASEASGSINAVSSAGLAPVAPALLTLSGAIAAAILGALGKYLYDLKIARRKDKLDRINSQLKYLYGPLYATDLAAQEVWRAFWHKLGRDPEVADNQEIPFTEKEDKEWRVWVTEVFMPLNERMERTIVENADLLESALIPPGLLTMCAHVACYKAIRKKWADQDFTETASPIDYPWKKFREHVAPTFKALKQEQAKLLAGTKTNANFSVTSIMNNSGVMCADQEGRASPVFEGEGEGER
jgi:hypothetical protein